LDVFGKCCLGNFWLLKRAQALFISNRMSPFWSFYNITIYKNLIWSKRITYNPCPEDSEGVIILKDLIFSLAFTKLTFQI
jgi:hypothetical protein